MIPDIYYHVYNRGAHKADVFLDKSDYIRMLKLLYIANDTRPFVMADLPENIFGLERKEPLVDVIAYCLMPNHIHIAVKKKTANEAGFVDSLARYMHKVMTGYSAYFNKKYGHSGTIWQGPYKAKVVYDGLYIQTLIKYIHLNPCSLANENRLRRTRDRHQQKSLLFAENYDYSSFKDYLGIIRKERSILNTSKIIPFQV